MHIAVKIVFYLEFFSQITGGSDYSVEQYISLWALIHVIILFHLSHILLWAVIIFSVYVQMYIKLITTDLNIFANVNPKYSTLIGKWGDTFAYCCYNVFFLFKIFSQITAGTDYGMNKYFTVGTSFLTYYHGQ